MSTIFIKGESIDLCLPEDEDFTIWAGWFNDSSITQYLEQGKFPHSVKDQVDFYNETRKNRFLVLIKNKNKKLLGVISLSEINYERSSCQISLVCPVKSKEAPLAALEAMALVTEHAFERLGMKRVWAGQAYPGLKKWSQQLEIIGFKTEGIARDNFVHGRNRTSSVNISVTLVDYLVLIKRRSGKLWPGEDLSRYLIKNSKVEEPMADKVCGFLDLIYREQDKFYLELEAGYEGLK